MRQHQKHAFLLCALWMAIFGFTLLIDTIENPADVSLEGLVRIDKGVTPEDPSASAPPTTEGVGMLDPWIDLDDPVRPMNHEDKTFRLHGYTDQSLVHRTHCRLHIPPLPLARKS